MCKEANEFNILKEKLISELFEGSAELESPSDFLNKMSQILNESQTGDNPMSFKKQLLKLKCENQSNNPMPEYQHEGDSGFDLRANLTEQVVLKPLQRKLIPTGLFFEIPRGYEIQIRPRSGLAAKYGVTVLNTPGTVDEKYRGEVQIILINLGDEDFIVNHGDRIAQGIVASVIGKRLLDIERIDKVSLDTDRGNKGFGSTGSV